MGGRAVEGTGLENRQGRKSLVGSNPTPSAKKWWIADREHEVFVVLFLDAQNRLIACEEMFRGTLTQTSVYPREVVKMALKHNAAAVIFAHNHPSGVAEPSRADERRLGRQVIVGARLALPKCAAALSLRSDVTIPGLTAPYRDIDAMAEPSAAMAAAWALGVYVDAIESRRCFHAAILAHWLRRHQYDR
jgi:hypothetical protein